LSLFLDGVEGTNNYEMTVIPSLAGTVSALEMNVRVVSPSIDDYQLSLHSTTENMEGRFTNSYLAPIDGTVYEPVRFTRDTCNSWGFATPRVPDNLSNAFDGSYTTLTNLNVSSATANFSAVPTIDTPIHHSPSEDETRPFYFAVCVNNEIPSDSYTATVVWTAISVEAKPQMAQNGDFIQDVTLETCPTDRIWVVDARDNRTYWIQKIPNSGAGGATQCWMQTNLAYAGGGDNTYGDVRTLIAHGSGPGMTNTSARWIAPASPTGSSNFTTNPTPPRTGVGNATGVNGAQYGFLYNWCGAMGGQTPACNTTATTGFDTSVSVCPAGWRLPVGGATNDPAVNDFSALNNAINSSLTTSDAGLRANWYAVYAGYLNTSGNYTTVGSWGYYWSSTADTPANARNFSFNLTTVNPATTLPKASGLAVRCML
jgi:uncharacterized protein (TIGR02145 family)